MFYVRDKEINSYLQSFCLSDIYKLLLETPKDYFGVNSQTPKNEFRYCVGHQSRMCCFFQSKLRMCDLFILQSIETTVFL